MARTTGRSGFKMRSGNRPSMSTLAGIKKSPAKFKLKYPKEEYTKRGFDPNMFSVRDGKVIKDGKYVMTFRHDPNDPASVGNRKPYDNYLKRLASMEAKIARSMEKGKARDEKVSPAKLKLDYKSMTKKQVRDAVIKQNRKGPKTSISMNHAMRMWNKAQERKGKDLEKFSDLEKFDDDRG